MKKSSLYFATAAMVILLGLCGAVGSAFAQVTFSKAFDPTTIGPGSVSTLTYTILNNTGSPLANMAFTENLPANVDFADPHNLSSDCLGADGAVNVSASQVSLTDGGLGIGATCIVVVDVTSSTGGAHTFGVVNLTYDGGNVNSDTADLTVVTSLPGFSKSFAPSTVPFGGRSTLTFTIDNSANGAVVNTLDFTDNLPNGMVIAEPNNASTTCGTSLLPPTLTAAAGTSIIDLFANGTSDFPAVAAESTCTVIVDVVATAPGSLGNSSGSLLASSVAAGKANATLQATRTDLAITKSFTDDPVPPGGTTTLDFTIHNFDRNFSATAVTFTDTLPTTEFTFGSLLSSDCGGSVEGIGTEVITLNGGTIAPESSCTISTSISVDAGVTPGTYLNITVPITGQIDGSPVEGNVASDTLFVYPVPLLTKEFTDDPVSPGDPVTLEFTITNTSTTSEANDIAFTDVFDAILPTASVVPATECCGVESNCAFTPLVNNPGTSVTPAQLTVSGGTLAAAGSQGDSCTFSITFDVASDAATGIYTNTTGVISATIDEETVIGLPASDTLEVVSAPQLIKTFTDDPVAPGGTVTLEFTLSYPAEASADATSIAFTDNLAATTPVDAGLVATGLPISGACNGAGTLSGSAGNTMLTFAGGTLAPGESCTFSVTLDVPGAAEPDTYTNTTSTVSATVSGMEWSGPAATDDLHVAGLSFTKEFIGDPVIAGQEVTLRFTIENIHPTLDATAISFTDDLDAVLDGTPDLSLAGLLPTTPCGPSSQITGTTFLTFLGGELAVGDPPCSFDIPILVPAGAADGDHINTTSSLTATQDGGLVIIDPATDALSINSNLLHLTKEFTDDPVAPGDSVTLEFTLTNLDGAQAASGIAFTDELDVALTGLVATGLPIAACGGTVSALDGGKTIEVSGASLPAGGSCTILTSLTVPGGADGGVYTNTTSVVTGTIAGFAVTGDAVSDDLEVIQLLDFSKAFDGPTTATGTAVLTFTIANPGSTDATDISFTDDLDAVIPGLVATGFPAEPCGAGSSISGVSLITFSDGYLAASGGNCSFDVDVLVPASASAGAYPNITSDLTIQGLTVAAPATADLTIEPPPTFAKEFAPDAIPISQTSTLTFTIDNTASALAATDLDFTDNFPSGVVVATPHNASTTCSGGTLTAAEGSGSISYTGGEVSAGASCTVQVDVTSNSVGTYDNTTGDLTSTSGNSGTALDSLTVDSSPAFSKAFSPDIITEGDTSTLSFTIDNTANTLAASSLDFTDDLPSGVVVATPANGSTTCSGGTLTATDGTGTISYSGGTVNGGASCVVQVDVTSSSAGIYVNTTGDLTSSLGNGGTASDSLEVVPLPLFEKVFYPRFLTIDKVSTLTFTIDNTGSTQAVSNLDFTDNLPAGVVIANPANGTTDCSGGVLTASPGAGVITYTGGAVSADASCSVDVDVTSSTLGTYLNVTGDLTSSVGNSGNASATLVVKEPFPWWSFWHAIMKGPDNENQNQ